VFKDLGPCAIERASNWLATRALRPNDDDVICIGPPRIGVQ
jgi:hypothetical protein